MDYTQVGAIGLLSIFVVTKLTELIRDLYGKNKKESPDELLEHKFKELDEKVDSLLLDIGKLRHRLYTTNRTQAELVVKIEMLLDGKIRNDNKNFRDE